MPTFTYNNNIPNAPNNPSDDQPKMQTNTNSIDSIIDVDHYSFESSGGRDGYHKQVHLFNEATPALGGADGVLFSGLSNGDSWPAWRNSNALTPIFLVNRVPNGSINGSASIAGGILLQWGVIPQAANLTNTVAFSPPFDVILNVSFSVMRINNTSPGSSFQFFIDNSSVNASGFNIMNYSGHSYGFYWFAIGIKN